MAAQAKAIIAVSGLGNGVGTGASVARLFSKELGYRVALISRPRKEVDELRDEIVKAGGQAEVFSVDAYDHGNLRKAFERIRSTWPDGRLKTAVWNTGQWSMIPFLDIKESDIQLSTQINIVSATAFAQEALRMFLSSSPSKDDTGGTLIFTGATSAWRGSAAFGAFAAGKHGLRAISQSIAREFGPQGVHVSFVVIDGTIRTKRTQALFANKEGMGEDWLQKDDGRSMSADSIAKTYLFLHQQDQSAWTLEMDLRPSREKF